MEHRTKRMKRRRFAAAALAGILFFGLFLSCPEGSDRVDAAEAVVGSGTCGESDVYWRLTQEADGSYCLNLYTEDGKEADVPGYNVNSTDKLHPWYDYQAYISKLVVGKGITGFGTQMMRGADSLETVVFEEGSVLKSIAAGAFRECIALESITFPDTLETISSNVFLSCEALTDVDLGSGLKTIGATSFKNCVSLTTLHFGSKLTTIKTDVFATISNLEKVYYDGTWAEYQKMMTSTKCDVDFLSSPEVEVIVSDGTSHYYGVSSVGSGADDTVVGCLNEITGVLTVYGVGVMADFGDGYADAPWAGSSVSTLVLFDSITKIGANAFADLISLKRVIYFGTEESWNALAAASGDAAIAPLKAENVDILYRLTGSSGGDTSYRMEHNGDGTYTLFVSGNGAVPGYGARTSQPWYYGASVITKVVVEDGVTAIGSYVFDNLRYMTEISFASSVKMIDYYSMRSCVSLASLTFPEGFENIGSNALNACTGLKEVHLPASLRAIDFRATQYCRAVTDVYYAGSRYSWENEIIIDNRYNDNGALTDAKLHFGIASVAAEDFTDLETTSPYYEAIQYLYNRNLVYGSGERFWPDLNLSSQEVIRALYRAAGADETYEDSGDWAVRNGLTDGGAGYAMTVSGLAELLYRAASYNGYEPETDVFALPETMSGEVSEALLWVYGEGYFDGLLETEGEFSTSDVLTRAQGFSVLAEWFASAFSKADRGKQIAAVLKGSISAGGDGKLYVIPVNINTEGLATKVGDATLVVFPDGEVMLIDSGVTGASDKIVSFLRNLGLQKLDYIVLSHAHPDHTGGFMDVLSYIYEEAGGSVGAFWFCGANAANGNVTAITSYLAGKGVERTDLKVDESTGTEVPVVETIGGVKVTVFGPNQADIEAGEDTKAGSDINNTSLIMKFTYGESTYLTTGDAYIAKEEYLVATYGEELQADVIKAGHHGYYQSNGQSWVETVKALICVAEINGNGNYGVQQRYMTAGTAYYSTGFDGTVMIAMDNARNYQVTTQYDSILRSLYTQESNTVTVSAQNASISPETAAGVCGDTIAYRISALDGYTLDSVELTDCAGNTWTLAQDAEGTYAIIVPFCDAVISVKTLSAVSSDPSGEGNGGSETGSGGANGTDSAQNPKTGDEAAVALWTALLAVSLAGIVLWLSRFRQRNTGKRN